jgi:hypothetical protein
LGRLTLKRADLECDVNPMGSQPLALRISCVSAFANFCLAQKSNVQRAAARRSHGSARSGDGAPPH